MQATMLFLRTLPSTVSASLERELKFREVSRGVGMVLFERASAGGSLLVRQGLGWEKWLT